MDLKTLLSYYELKEFYLTILLAIVLVAAWKWDKLEYELRPIFVVVFSALLTQMAGFYFNCFGIPGDANRQVYYLTECAIFGWYYYMLIENRLIKRIILAITLPYCMIRLIILFTSDMISQQSHTNGSLDAITITSYSFLYFWQLIRKDELISLKLNPHFWIIANNLIFYISAFLCTAILSMRSTIRDSDRWVVNEVFHYLNLLIYLGYLTVFICFPLKRTSYTLQPQPS